MLWEKPNCGFSVEIPTSTAPPLDNLDRLCYLGVTTMPRRNMCAFYGDARSRLRGLASMVLYQCRKGDRETTRKGTIMACWGYYSAKRWTATIEEANTATTLRKDVLAAIDDSNMSEDAREWAKWMVCRVSDESLERKVRRSHAEEWFANAIASLKPGDTFTQTGLLETFNAPDNVCGYASFILTEWAYQGERICFTRNNSNTLMQTTVTCNIYKVL